MAARAIGSATVSFGLVSIPLKIYTTNKTSANISFKMVNAETGARLKQQYIDANTGEVVPRDQMGKGYEFAKDQFVVFTKEEIKALEAVTTNAIELVEFVPAAEVDPVYFDKAYYLGPDKGGERAYNLLSTAMTETDLVGIAKYSSRGKQYVVVVRPFDDGGMVMHQLRFSDEVRAFEDVPIEDAPELADAELQLAIQIIEQIAKEEFHLDNYKNEVRARVLDLIQQKVDGQEITAAPEAPKGQIIDLMAALKASLGAKGKGDEAAADEEAPAAKKAPKKKPAKKTAAKRKPAKQAPAAKKKTAKRAKAK
jgi:DNA end-binding protein Ku